MKIFHFQLEDSLGNKKTLICNLRFGSIRYRLYGGWSDSGMIFSVQDIHFKNGGDLPVKLLSEKEKTHEFSQRVWNMLKDSSDKPKWSIPVNIKFADL